MHTIEWRENKNVGYEYSNFAITLTTKKKIYFRSLTLHFIETFVFSPGYNVSETKGMKVRKEGREKKRKKIVMKTD